MNPHPPLSSFPFVLLSLLVIIESISYFHKGEFPFDKLRLFLVCCLIIFAPITYYSGFWGLDYAEQSFAIPSEIIETHRSYARFFLILIAPLAIFTFLKHSNSNSKVLRIAYFTFLLISLILISYVSYLGGELVFTHGAGVKVSK